MELGIYDKIFQRCDMMIRYLWLRIYLNFVYSIDIIKPQNHIKKNFYCEKNCKIYDGSDYSYEIGDYKNA